MIKFGTGGIRGLMKEGEFDEKLVEQASRAVASWMVEEGLKTIVIAYDTRMNSDLFAKISASVISSFGIEVYLFPEPVPTPLLSFAVRKIEAGAGIVITASHNPPDYNGFKVYTKDGVQAIPEYTEKIAKYMDNPVNLSRPVKVRTVPPQIVKEYIEMVVKVVEPLVENDTTIVYSPLHGTGARFVPKVLEMLGFKVVCVEEQMNPDPHFSTVTTPNPEEESAFAQSDKYQSDSTFAIATDPDCDRVGLKVGSVKLSGNQIGVLLTDMLQQDQPSGSHLIKTIVTTDMVYPMCEKKGQVVLETPTGFKFIGSEIEKRSSRENFKYFLAFEESCGYLTGDFVRDKDGVLGSALIAAMCSKVDPLERLKYLYDKYGYYIEKLISINLTTPDQARKIYEKIRDFPPNKIGSTRVSKVYDYSQDTQIPNETLLLEANGAKIYIRPSGTEPKLKIYFKVVDENERQALRKIEELQKGMTRIEDFT
ncbi:MULTISPECIES: phospho-sugar mutase [Pseudothermotoga]|uniref:phospho-sugar mutase n=1 Tax=Pseudothermotoga TaxID=1643951 RepID=UPI0004078CA5|nr:MULTISPECIES: phospho-sugar mutase [Pseudothermotoga]HBJ81664.1 phospho-sugar mutase [Pseudothermotoga sp.]HBT26311.1 phospho-sugar mutase [Pseudothermotoga sp.]